MKVLGRVLMIIGLSLTESAHAAEARAEQTVRLTIASQPIASALNEFARQSGLQIFLTSEDAVGVVTPKLSGTFTPSAALTQLLSNTGLQYEYINAHTIAVRAKSSKADPAKKSAAMEFNGRMYAMMAQADGTEQAAAGDAGQDKTNKKNKSSDGVEEMLVEGVREKSVPFSTASLDLTRSADDALPFTVFTARDLELSGTTNLQDFLREKLPQNFNDTVIEELPDAVGQTQIAGIRSGQVSMRGWSSAETVFLLNGRRMTPQYMGTQSVGTNTTPDLRGIPLASIERVEILSSAGSAIYGANATGGVINIITRQDFKGGQLSVSYASPADVHAPTRGINANYSSPFYWRTNLRFSAGYNESEPLSVRDRVDVAGGRWRALIGERQPSRLMNRTAGVPYGATPNIRTVAVDSAANLFGAGTSNFTTVPNGYTGGGGLSAFQPGIYNINLIEKGGGRYSLDKSGYMGANTSDMVFNFGIDKNFSDTWRWSLEYRRSQNNVEDPAGGNAVEVLRVPALAPTNIFGQNLSVALADPGFSRPELRNISKNTTWGFTSTLHGAIGEWRGYWDVGISGNENTGRFEEYNQPTIGWAAALLSGAYNPFVDLRVASPAAASFYDDYLAYRFNYTSAGEQRLSTLKASGPLLRFPLGSVQLTAGVDWSQFHRTKSRSYSRYENGVTRQVQAPVGSTSAGVSDDNDPGRRFATGSNAVYAELSVPLALNLPLLDRLELFASARSDRQFTDAVRYSYATGELVYEPFQASTRSHVHALGLRYDALEGVAFRMSQSIGFKPPSIYDLSPGDPPSPGSILEFNDARRPSGGVPSVVELGYTQFGYGGNPDLRPETTTSRNFGVILAPVWLHGLRLSIDYIDNVRDDVITGLSPEEMIAFEAELPGLVTRGASDGHPSGVGPITFMDLRSINFRQISSRSVDFSLEQKFQDVLGGRLSLTVMATKNISFKVQTTNTTAPEERVRSRNSTYSQQIAWNGNGQLRWDGQRWGFGWSVRYYDYLLAAPTDWILQGSDRAPWKLNHDAFMSYRALKGENAAGWQRLLSGSSITFGVRNVFDREPRFWAARTNTGIAPYDSLTGRSLWLQMRKDF